MELYYNAIPLHDFGKVIVAAQGAVGEPEEAPQAWRHTLRVKLNVHTGTFEDKYALVEEVRRALLTQQGVLKWVDGNGATLLEQTVTLTGHDWPEDPNEKLSRWFQSLHLSFSYHTEFTAEQNASLTATYQRAGGPLLTLGHVEKVRDELEVNRYAAFRSHRESSARRLTLAGKFRSSARLSLEARRAALEAAHAAMTTEIVERMEGELSYAGIDKTVRVVNFTADLDQEINYIPWSLTCQYTDFPNEAGYAQAQFQVGTREDDREGKKRISLSGEIAAESKTNAMAKLESIRAAWVSGHIRLSSEVRDERIDGSDGASFIKLTFQEEYEAAVGSVIWELRTQDVEEGTQATLRRSYSGFAEATSTASYAAAYEAARGKAIALGDNRHQFQLSRQVTVTDPQQSSERVTTGDYRCRVEFQFEYRLKGARVYCELSNRFQAETFGVNTEVISGFIAAGTAATARGLLSDFRGTFTSQLGSRLRAEEISEPRIFIRKDATSTVPVGSANTTVAQPGADGAWDDKVNTSETLASVADTGGNITAPDLDGGANYVRQWVRLDFSWTFHRLKTSPSPASAVALRYSLETSEDFANNEKVTTIPDGMIWATTEAVAETYLTTFLAALNVTGEQVYLRKAKARERYPGKTAGLTPGDAAGTDTFIALGFSTQWNGPISPDNAILQCELSEEIECSGKRLVVQPTALGYDVLQGAAGECGTQSGRRTLSGSCVATNETTAMGWIKKQFDLKMSAEFAHGATGDNPKGAWNAAQLPPSISFEPQFIPLTEGVLRPQWGLSLPGANFKAVRARFRITELYQELTVVG